MISLGSGNFYNVADSATLTLQNGDWCIGCWATITAIVVNQDLISIADPGDGNYATIRIRRSGLSFPGQLNLILGDGTNSASNVNGASTFIPGDDGIERLFIMQRNTSANQFELWACAHNGSAILDITRSDSGWGAINAGAWTIGHQDGSIAEFFKGNFSLSQAEIESLAAGKNIFGIGKAPDAYITLLAADPTARDLSGNNNDGTRNGSPATVAHPLNLYNLRRRRL